VKLILVEDEPVILECTEDALTEAGFEVQTAATGTEALALLSNTPDCLAMMVDVRLEADMDGWEIARRARADQPHIAIIYTTTADNSEYRGNAVERSVLLEKPYSLERAVRAALEAVQEGRIARFEVTSPNVRFHLLQTRPPTLYAPRHGGG
jgi:CheY-like chemotaxis protein